MGLVIVYQGPVAPQPKIQPAWPVFCFNGKSVIFFKIGLEIILLKYIIIAGFNYLPAFFTKRGIKWRAKNLSV